jgi:hypothetical protein
MIHLQPIVYRDYAGFYGKKGAPGRPITLDGHGATLEGSDPIDPAKWKEVSPGLFAHDDLLPRLDDAIIGRWFFLWNGRMNHMGRTSKGKHDPLKKPEELQPGEWTFVRDRSRDKPSSSQYYGTFYLKLPSGQKLCEARIAAPMRSAGVQMSGDNAHLVIRNLTATHPYNDGFNIHGDCRDVVFENIRAIECGDDGISAHETAEYRVDGFVSIGNSTGITDTVAAKTSYNHVFLAGNLAFDLFFLNNGRYKVENAIVLSSAEHPLTVTALPNQHCELILDNVYIRRLGKTATAQVQKNAVLRAKRLTLENMDVSTSGEATFENCLINGQEMPPGSQSTGADRDKLFHEVFSALVPRPTPPAPGKELVFFAFDDVSIPWRSNLKLTMVTAEKHPANPVLRRGPAGAPDHGLAIMYGSVLHSGGKFRMWYLGMSQTTLAGGQAPGYWRPMCYAESDEGIHWTKPALGLVEFNGSKKNNICLIESEVFSLSRVNDFLTVLYEPDEPNPAKRYKCAFIAHPLLADVKGGRSKIGPEEKRWGAFVCATSADGLRWKVVGDRPMNAGGERFEVSGLYRFNGFYYAPGQLISPWMFLPDGREVGRAMRTYRSADFEHWDPTPALGFVRPGQTIARPVPGQQTHMGAGVWNRGNVLLGLYGQWQDPPQPPPRGARSHLLGTRIDLGFILSNDGIHWREPVPDHKTIARGKQGEWDSIALLQAHAFANVGEQTYLWYSHWDCDGEFRDQDIGLATLRRDGFGYLSPLQIDAPASCETVFFEARRGARLFVNADGLSAEAPLTVELLDERLQVIDRARVSKSGTAVEALKLPAGRIAVRVSFSGGSRAKLYAISIGQ